jgi:hypothetical protein
MKKKDMAQINDFDKFLNAFDKGCDVLPYATDGKAHIVCRDWFASKMAASTPRAMVEISMPAYKIAYEKADANNLTVSQFISNLLIGKVAAL